MNPLTRRHPIRRSLLIALVVAPLAGPLAAQSSRQNEERRTLELTLDDLRAAFCVEFLARPEDAAQFIDRPFVPRPASEVRELHPALRQVLAEDAAYAAWIPGQVCLFDYSTGRFGSRTAVEVGSGTVPRIAVLGLAVNGDSGRVPNVAVRLLTNSERLAEVARDSLLAFETYRVKKAPPRDSMAPERFELKVGRALLVWDGHIASDTTTVGGATEFRWATDGFRNSRWILEATIHPRTRRAFIGAFRIEGNDRLAKMLRASPIRYVGPVGKGGEAKLVFLRR